MYLVYVFLCLVNFTIGLFIQDYALHESMSEPELCSLFNSQNSKDIPEYQIIYLPVVRIQEASGIDEGEIEVNYGFPAFYT